MEIWKRMFHVCDFDGTILDFPDATDATYPIGTWSASDTPKILKFICPRFGQWIQTGYPVTNSCSTLQLDFSPLIPAWNALQAWSLDWFLPKAVLVQILQTCPRWAPPEVELFHPTYSWKRYGSTIEHLSKPTIQDPTWGGLWWNSESITWGM